MERRVKATHTRPEHRCPAAQRASPKWVGPFVAGIFGVLNNRVQSREFRIALAGQTNVRFDKSGFDPS